MGSKFLPPINTISKAKYEKVPLLKVDQSGKHLKAKYESIEMKKPTPGIKEEIHAFDGNHLSMPQYSLKYKNEPNAAAMRHLLGGKVVNGEGIN